ncbi:MAG: helix-turn-helix transcriptional regulator [Burkholderiales bacterium]|nr:MAG: helix-turn-helix transcriptional regulator [Burkholderiales bacterium]
MDMNTAVDALAALAQAKRLSVFRLLVRHAPDGLAAGEIASELGIANNTLSFHLKELTRAGLIRPRQAGRHVFYAPDLHAMNALLGYLLDDCCQGRQECVPARTGARKRALADCS